MAGREHRSKQRAESSSSRPTDRFSNRAILEAKYLDSTFFESENFSICSVLDSIDLRKFCELHCPYSESLVRSFYRNLSFHGGILTSLVKGIRIEVSDTDWEELIGYTYQEPQDEPMEDTPSRFDGLHYSDFDSFDRESFLISILRPQIASAGLTRFSVKKLKVDPRILQYVITHIILPRHANHAIVLEHDLFTMWAITRPVHLDWRYTLCKHMQEASYSTSAHLPYAMLVQKIMELKGVSMAGEVLKPLTLKNNCFGKQLLIKSQIIYRSGRWRWDDDTDTDESDDDAMEEEPHQMDDQEPTHIADPIAAAAPASAPTSSASSPSLQDLYDAFQRIQLDIAHGFRASATHHQQVMTELTSLGRRISRIEAAHGIASDEDDEATDTDAD